MYLFIRSRGRPEVSSSCMGKTLRCGGRLEKTLPLQTPLNDGVAVEMGADRQAATSVSGSSDCRFIFSEDSSAESFEKQDLSDSLVLRKGRRSSVVLCHMWQAKPLARRAWVAK